LLGFLQGIFGLDAKYTQQSSNTICRSSSFANSCTWNDGKCHSVWVSDAALRISGYIRRRCDYSNDTFGDYTVWSHDFAFDVPTGAVEIGCAALCGDSTYRGASADIPLPSSAISCVSSTPAATLPPLGTSYATPAPKVGALDQIGHGARSLPLQMPFYILIGCLPGLIIIFLFF
jgi:hypothetical protein